MAGRSTHWLTGLWSLAIAGLVAIVVLELTGDAAIAPDVTAAAPATVLPAAPPEPGEYQPPPQHQFNEISARPLFFPSRRPFVPPAGPAAAEAVAPSTGIELIGVLLTEQERAALVQPQGEAAAHWVHERQTVAGWLVEAIAADHVQLRDGDRVEIVKLRADQAPAEPKAKPKPSVPKAAKARVAAPAATARKE